MSTPFVLFQLTLWVEDSIKFLFKKQRDALNFSRVEAEIL